MAKNGLELITPTSIAYTGTSATVSANGSVSFDTCTAISLNGVFSADYDNYMIVLQGKDTVSASGTINFRLRAAGTDNSTASSYVAQTLTADSSNLLGSRLTQNRFILTGDFTNTLKNGLVLNVYGPHLAQPTAMRTIGAYALNGASMYETAGTHNQSTSYDGFSLVSFSGTGRVAVYGMRK